MWMLGTAVVLSRLPFRSRGKRDVKVERRRSEGGFSLVRSAAAVFCSPARSASDWLEDDAPEMVRSARGRGRLGGGERELAVSRGAGRDGDGLFWGVSEEEGEGSVE
jgi:hypothetical protein